MFKENNNYFHESRAIKSPSKVRKEMFYMTFDYL